MALTSRARFGLAAGLVALSVAVSVAVVYSHHVYGQIDADGVPLTRDSQWPRPSS